MTKAYSPCIKVCKYRDDGHCLGCSMTKSQKKISKKLKSKETQTAFVQLICLQQVSLGGYEAWEKAHLDRYEIKDKAAF